VGDGPAFYLCFDLDERAMIGVEKEHVCLNALLYVRIGKTIGEI